MNNSICIGENCYIHVLRICLIAIHHLISDLELHTIHQDAYVPQEAGQLLK